MKNYFVPLIVASVLTISVLIIRQKSAGAECPPDGNFHALKKFKKAY